jgi:hypothetical protein
MEAIMRLSLSASLAAIAFIATMAANSNEANAVVCAAGVYRAGCAAVGVRGAAAVGVRSAAVVGVHGAAVVRRPVGRRAVVVR